MFSARRVLLYYREKRILQSSAQKTKTGPAIGDFASLSSASGRSSRVKGSTECTDQCRSPSGKKKMLEFVINLVLRSLFVKNQLNQLHNIVTDNNGLVICRKHMFESQFMNSNNSKAGKATSYFLL